MSTNYFDFLEQNSSDSPASSTQGNNNEGMVNLTTRADAECQVVCDGDFLFLLPPNQIIKEKAPVGQHILQFISTEYPDVVVEKVVDFPEAGKNYLVMVSEFKALIADKSKLVSEPAPVVETIVSIDFTAKLGGKGTYTGQIKDGKPEGRGKVIFESGNVYVGEFRNGWRHGKGVITFANGEKYEGDSVEDMRTGHGIYTYVNGNKLEGEFLDGNIQNKTNIFTWANGDRLECEGWDNGSTGKGIYTWANGTKEEQLWCQGKNITSLDFVLKYISFTQNGGAEISSSISNEILSEIIKKEIRPAAEWNNATAQFVLGIAYEDGRGVYKDMFEAVKWYKESANNGYSAAQYFYGYCFQHGNGVAADHASALLWYRKAAEQGYAPAQNNLGSMYEHGLGVPKNFVEAANWYRLAAEQGLIAGLLNYGRMCKYGEGVPKDVNKAIQLYKKAADQGSEEAKKRLKEM